VQTPAPAVIADRYRLGALLGQGGRGEVRDGTDLRPSRPVAVKILRRDLAAQPELRQRFESEAKAAAGLVHPNVVAVFDTGEEEGVPYIVMERLPGRTVADEIAEGRLSPERVERLGREVLAALEAAHGAGLVHRDIKPGNLLVAPDASVKVADFGIAKAAEALGPDITVTGQVIGTPAYLAPERLEGGPGTARGDLYSLGVVMYEALTGTKPYAAETPWGLAQEIMEGRHRPLAETAPGTPPALAAAVERAMATVADHRFATAAEMAAALAATSTATPTRPVAAARPEVTQKYSDGVPSSGSRPAGPDPADRRDGWTGKGRGIHLRRRLAALAVVVGVVVVALLLALAGGDGSPRTEAPVPTTAPSPTSNVPQPLDRALDELERSVRP
jgi:serine/threonine protein kinase